MLNDVKSPPPMSNADQPLIVPIPSTPKLASDIHVDRQEPGVHKARIFGEKTHLDPEYAMPMEERGSTFNVGLTVAALVIVVVVLVAVFVAIR